MSPSTPAIGARRRPLPFSGWIDRWFRRWVSLGGAVSAVGVGNLAAALNWNAIARGLSASPDAIQAAAQAELASQRYGIWGFALLVVGQQMVTRRELGLGRKS